MVKNSLIDLHNMLMEQAQRLNESENADEILQEVQKSKAMSDIAGQIVNNARIMLDAQRISYEYGNGSTENTIYQLELGK